MREHRIGLIAEPVVGAGFIIAIGINPHPQGVPGGRVNQSRLLIEPDGKREDGWPVFGSVGPVLNKGELHPGHVRRRGISGTGFFEVQVKRRSRKRGYR